MFNLKDGTRYIETHRLCERVMYDYVKREGIFFGIGIEKIELLMKKATRAVNLRREFNNGSPITKQQQQQRPITTPKQSGHIELRIFTFSL